jgi:bacterioferritin-associated ferredoxin
MIVCLCKVLSEDDIYTAIEKGATNAKKVHAALKPELVSRPCPSCVFSITKMIKEGPPKTRMNPSQAEHAGCCRDSRERVKQ